LEYSCWTIQVDLCRIHKQQAFMENIFYDSMKHLIKLIYIKEDPGSYAARPIISFNWQSDSDYYKQSTIPY
jgi:hypothetical protein